VLLTFYLSEAWPVERPRLKNKKSNTNNKKAAAKYHIFNTRMLANSFKMEKHHLDFDL